MMRTRHIRTTSIHRIRRRRSRRRRRHLHSTLRPNIPLHLRYSRWIPVPGTSPNTLPRRCPRKSLAVGAGGGHPSSPRAPCPNPRLYRPSMPPRSLSCRRRGAGSGGCFR
ncbi:hypothetical protein BDZ91DRAFT_733876 [Kalaharituber pfeilii]|nr:hypothetical protein BDZ91DRAFT_733876 [Kalaharituber pfeilii]